MSKVKMRYVAQIEIEDWTKENAKTLPIAEIKKNLKGMDEYIKSTLDDNLNIENGSIIVTQMYKDVWRVDDDMEEVSGSR